MSNPLEEKLTYILNNLPVHHKYGTSCESCITVEEAVQAILLAIREAAPEAYTITNPYPEMEDTNTHYQLGWNDCRHVLLERLGTNA